MIGKERKVEDDRLTEYITVSPKDEHTSTTCVSTKGEVNNARSLTKCIMWMHDVPTKLNNARSLTKCMLP